MARAVLFGVAMRALVFVLVASLVACTASGSGDRLCSGSSALGDGAGLEFTEHVKGSSATAIVVALHGCTQTAKDYEAAGWNEVADAKGFAVVYVQQSTANNAQRCFRWWDPAQTSRDQGEAAAIASAALAAKAKYGAAHVYVTGLSAGAAMSVAMLASYPDVFEAGAIMAGIPFGCAKSLTDSFACTNGKDQTPDAWAALLPDMARSSPPRISIWQGTADYIVRPTNADQLVRQWTKAHGADAKATSSETVGVATHETFANGAVERWSIEGMGHGTAVDPASGCGHAGAFVLDEKLCSTAKAAEFFGLTTDSASAPAPAPSGGSHGAPHHTDCTN